MDIISAALARTDNLIELTFADGTTRASNKFARVLTSSGESTHLYTMETGKGLYIVDPGHVIYVRLM